MVSFHIETYGCAANRDDSSIMKGLLSRSGFQLSSEEHADILIVNTCAVKHTTEQKILSRISSLRKKYPGKKLVVAGCMPASGQYEFPEADGILGTNAADILKLIRRMEKGKAELIGKSEKLGYPKFSISPAVQAVQISEGCLGNCAYCITKLSRGKLNSYEPEKIINEVRKAVASGMKEIWLTSQDNAVYGADIGSSLPELLRQILDEVKGHYRIRIGMANPLMPSSQFRELLDVMEDERIYKFLHLPVQSGSSEVLAIMKRGYTVGHFISLVHMSRSRWPELNLWTDMIVGHPGEAEDDFRKSMELIKEVVPDFVNVSMFSSRPGTEASRMKKIPSETIKARSREMSRLVSRTSLTRNSSWVGWKGKVLITEWNQHHQTWMGRNYAYKQVIIKDAKKKDLKYGQWADVEIVDAIPTGIIGKLA